MKNNDVPVFHQLNKDELRIIFDLLFPLLRSRSVKSFDAFMAGLDKIAEGCFDRGFKQGFEYPAEYRSTVGDLE